VNAERNGDEIITIGHRGRRTFQFEGGGEPFTVDVVAVNNQLFSLRDKYPKNEDGKLAVEDLSKWHEEIRDYVASLAGIQSRSLSLTEALEFQKRVGEETNKLLPFFESESPSEPSLRESSGLHFST